MTECTHLSDRMPAAALERAEWTPEDLRHLSGCESCRREWELIRMTSRLGDGVLPPFDAGASSRGLVQRLGRWSDHRRHGRAWGAAGLAAAAAIAALWTGQGTTPHSESGPGSGQVVAGLQIPLPELDGLQPTELDSVLRNMDEPAGIDAAGENPDLGELDSEELETVLDIWEG